MKTKFLFLPLLALMMVSCATYTYRETTARYVEPSRAGFITPVAADMEVQQQKIENSVEIEAVLKKRQITAIMMAEAKGVESAIVLNWKKYALAQTLKKYNADDIISPNFEIAPSNRREGYIVVTVSGHPAVYKNYRKATKEDVDLIEPFLEHKNDIKANGVLLIQRYK